jgi:RNA polymerase sigma factor (TIGR02999 family)
MRRILVDTARAHKHQKRGGGAPVVALDEALVVSPERSREIIALDEALEALAVLDARKSQVVELRYFGGLTVAETAEALHVSRDTVLRDCRMARGWLLRELSGKRPGTWQAAQTDQLPTSNSQFPIRVTRC